MRSPPPNRQTFNKETNNVSGRGGACAYRRATFPSGTAATSASHATASNFDEPDISGIRDLPRTPAKGHERRFDPAPINSGLPRQTDIPSIRLNVKPDSHSQRNSFSLWRRSDDKLSIERDLRFYGIRDEALCFDGLHDFAGKFEFGFIFELTRGRTITSVMRYLPSIFSSRPSVSLSYRNGVRPFAWASVRKVSIMHVLTEPTNSSSGAQMSGSPLNSGGLPTSMFGFPDAESVPRRAELQAVLALERKDLWAVFVPMQTSWNTRRSRPQVYANEPGVWRSS
jgi:hypothetical protein